MDNSSRKQNPLATDASYHCYSPYLTPSHDVLAMEVLKADGDDLAYRRVLMPESKEMNCT